MRWWIALWSCVFFEPAAFAACAPAFSEGGSGLAPTISSDERRALESLLRAQVDDVVCAFMKPERRRGFRPPGRSGFFVLTPNEAVFVRDDKELEVLFRAELAAISRYYWMGFGSLPSQLSAPGYDEPLDLLLVVGGELFSFTLSCAGGATRILTELEQRTGLRPAHPPDVARSAPCGR